MPTAPRWFPAWRHAWVRLLTYFVAAFVAYIILVYSMAFAFGPTQGEVWTVKILKYGLYAALAWFLIRAMFFKKKN